MAFGKTKTAPTPYPRIIFHGIRVGQALASIIVSSIMFYFIWNLIHEDFETPRTFWTLLAASLATFLFLVATLFVYICTGLSPLVNLIGNGVLLLLWAPAFGYLWFFTRATLGHVCNRRNWQGPVGISVCRVYKALFAFAMLGLTTTLLAFLLDLYVWRKTTSRGKYSQMKGNEKPMGIAAPNQPYGAPEYSDSRSSIALDQYTTQYTTPQTQKDERSGYQVPEEQFAYNDTAYHGGHDPSPAAKRD